MKKRIIPIISSLLIINVLIIIVCHIIVYIKDNSLINRTLYYYGRYLEKNKDMVSIDKYVASCLKDNYIIQDFRLNNINVIGKYPKNDKEVVVTKKYCEEKVVEDNKWMMIYNCDDIIGSKINILGEEKAIVGLVDSTSVNINIYKIFKENVSNDIILVNDRYIESKCNKDDYIYKVVFKSNKKLEKFSKDKNVFYESDKYIREYWKYLYLILGILLIVDIILVMRRRYEIKKSK